MMPAASLMRRAGSAVPAAGDEALQELNVLLADAEREATERFSIPRFPVIFIVGSPRSGHTLFSQLLAATGAFGYITNFTARFWEAPYLAARLQETLGLAGSLEEEEVLASRFGKTAGWGSPHEGGNFLRRWLPFSETHRSDLKKLDPARIEGFRRELAALEDVYQRPIFLRNLIYGLNLDLVQPVFEDALFLHCTRDAVFQAQSILMAREEITGDRAIWWSLRPVQYPTLVELPAIEQVVEQIYWSRRAVSDGLEGIPASRVLDVRYEEVVADPRAVIDSITARLRTFGAELSADVGGIPERLGSSNVRRVGSGDFAAIEHAVKKSGGPSR